MTCPPPSKVDHGIFSPDKTIYQFKDEVKYSCEEGYIMTGNDFLSCSQSGTFTSPPTCASKFFFVFLSILCSDVFHTSATFLKCFFCTFVVVLFFFYTSIIFYHNCYASIATPPNKVMYSTWGGSVVSSLFVTPVQSTSLMLCLRPHYWNPLPRNSFCFLRKSRWDSFFFFVR